MNIKLIGCTSYESLGTVHTTRKGNSGRPSFDTTDPSISDVVRHSTAHRENFFLNLVESTRNQIVFNIFRSIWNQTDVRLVPNFFEFKKKKVMFGQTTYFKIITKCKGKLWVPTSTSKSEKKTLAQRGLE